jgi:hypothetical protein
MDDEESVAYVLAVTRPDTLKIRVPNIQLGCMTTIYLVLEGVKCNDHADGMILDWCEMHANFGRLRLHTGKWLRDLYGRVLGDLADPDSGELLTDYLVANKAATEYPQHYMDTLTAVIHAKEPEE